LVIEEIMKYRRGLPEIKPVKENGAVSFFLVEEVKI
jgi:hypothetical protein